MKSVSPPDAPPAVPEQHICDLSLRSGGSQLTTDPVVQTSSSYLVICSEDFTVLIKAPADYL